MTVAPKGGACKTRKRKVDREEPLQPTLLSLMPYDKKSDRAKRLTDLVTNYIVSGMVPIYTVEKDAFVKLLKGLDPRYQCPGRNFFAKTAIPERYQQEKSALTTSLKNITFLSCTTDGWSSLSKDPYMSLTVHYVDQEWKVESKCIATTYLPESHTADNVANFITETLTEYDIPIEKIVSITTDSAANMIAACNKLSTTRISCFGHILHNAITKTLNSNELVNALSVAARKIVSVFSYSFQYKKKLQKLQKDLGLPENKITNDVSTRWGSKLKMFSSLKSQMTGIDKLFVEDRKYRSLMFSFKQKDLLAVVVEAIEPYSHLTDLLSGEKAVTVSSVAPMLIHLHSLIEPVSDEDVDSDPATPTVASLRAAIWDYVSHRYTDLEVNKILACGTLLDRRYDYVQPPIENWPSMEEMQDDLVRQVVEIISQEGTDTSSSVTVTNKANNKSLAAILGRKKADDNNQPQAAPDQLVQRELQFFLTMECPDVMEINEWWKSHKAEFRNLAKMAQKMFSVNATSVPSERLFSLSGHIVNKKRCSLKPHMVNMLSVLAFNSK